MLPVDAALEEPQAFLNHLEGMGKSWEKVGQIIDLILGGTGMEATVCAQVAALGITPFHTWDSGTWLHRFSENTDNREPPVIQGSNPYPPAPWYP